MPNVRTLDGKIFEAIEGEAMLDAALRANVTLDYSCRTGRCSTCKTRVSRGSTVALHDETGLTRAEIDAGWILSCVRGATSDVEIDVESLGDVKLPPAKTLPCRIQSLQKISADVMKIVLRLPPNNSFDYLPGQYIDVVGHGGVRRSYSIANAPRADQTLEIHVRQVLGGVMSQYWFEQAKPNDLLRFHGPLGTFFLRSIDGLDLIFLATGTGIAPVKSMLEQLGQSGQSKARSVSVFWGGRTQSDLYWDVQQTASRHQFVPVLSRAGSEWRGETGHVQQALLSGQWDWQRAVVYACGSDAMIHDARQQLIEAGLSERRFHSDAFVCSAAV